MKFSTRKDIEAPLDFVFARAANFEAIERQVLRRGVELQRTKSADATGVGLAWSARAKVRGKMRDFDATVTAFDPPNGYTVEGRVDGLSYLATVETIELSRTRTRLLAALDLRPTTLTARLLVQSLKLAKGTLSAKFDTRISSFAQDIEDRYAARQTS